MLDTIFLDMDGVLTDLRGALGKLWGLTKEQTYTCYDLETPSGTSREEFWAPVLRMGSDFWADLEPFEWSQALYDLAKSFCDNVYICSSPFYNGDSVKGKLEWLNHFFDYGKPFRNYVFTPRKFLLARPSAVLIDDFDGQVVSFRDAGGKAITFPWPYNQSKVHTDAKLAYIEAMLRHLFQAEGVIPCV